MVSTLGTGGFPSGSAPRRLGLASLASLAMATTRTSGLLQITKSLIEFICRVGCIDWVAWICFYKVIQRVLHICLEGLPGQLVYCPVYPINRVSDLLIVFSDRLRIGFLDETGQCPPRVNRIIDIPLCHFLVRNITCAPSGSSPSSHDASSCCDDDHPWPETAPDHSMPRPVRGCAPHQPPAEPWPNPPQPVQVTSVQMAMKETNSSLILLEQCFYAATRLAPILDR